MKKLFCVLFLSLLIFGSVCAADTDYTGIWYLNFFSMDGENLLNVSDLGMRSTMTLNEDGTAAMTMDMSGENETAEGTWSVAEEGVAVVINEDTQVAVLQDSYLVFDSGDSGKMFYGREEPAPGFELAEPNKEAKAEDFEGKWIAFKLGMEEVGFFDWETVASDLGFETNEVVIKDGVMTLFGDEKSPVELTAEEDGVMANRFENRDYSMLDTVVKLHEDGKMSIESMTMIFVLEKAEEEK